MTTRSPERAQFLADVITTATEGGIQYWARVTGYRWFSPELEGGTAEPGPGGTANAWVELVDAEEDDGERHRVDLDKIAHAFGVVRQGTPKGWNDDDVARMRQAYAELDAGEIDAGDADCLLQLAIFGEVVYG
jgi:hypothetical protein